jgi:hypothetical protein
MGGAATLKEPAAAAARAAARMDEGGDGGGKWIAEAPALPPTGDRSGEAARAAPAILSRMLKLPMRGPALDAPAAEDEEGFI